MLQLPYLEAKNVVIYTLSQVNCHILENYAVVKDLTNTLSVGMGYAMGKDVSDDNPLTLGYELCLHFAD